MKRAPFRLLFFLAALVALGVFALAVTIPNVFKAGEPIVAEEVNENFATLATAVEELGVEFDTLTEAVDGVEEFEADFSTLTAAIEDVESDLASLATTVEAGLGAREVVVGGPDLAVEEVGLSTNVATTVEGRWHVSQGFDGFTLCGSAVDVRFFLMVDDVPVASTVMYADQNEGVRARLSGPTERVLPAGEHELKVATECVGPEFVDAAVLTSDDAYSIVVFAE